MTGPAEPIQEFWDDMLSSVPERIQKAYVVLDSQMQAEVIAHLHQMVSEDGWHPLQRASARAALQALDLTNPDQ